jgi:hypothetical protein
MQYTLYYILGPGPSGWRLSSPPPRGWPTPGAACSPPGSARRPPRSRRVGGRGADGARPRGARPHVMGASRACGPCSAGPGPSGPWVGEFCPRSAVGASLRRTDRRTDGRTDGRADRRTGGQTDGRTDGFRPHLAVGASLGRTDGQTDGRTGSVPVRPWVQVGSTRERSNYLELDRTISLVYLARAPGWGWW